MSSKHYDYCCCKPVVYDGCSYQNRGNGLGFAALIILILIILQFKKGAQCKDDYDEEYDSDYEECEEDDDEDEDEDEEDEYRRGCDTIVDNGILFIIALFYLACCGKKLC